MCTKRFGGIRPFLARLFVTRMPASFIQSVGNFAAALKYMKAVRRIPAYRRAVKKHLGSIPLFISPQKFAKLPVLDKKSYLQAHPLQELLATQIDCAYCLQRSSGFSGKATYWLKTPREAREANLTFRLGWENYFNPRNESVLVIIGFSLGTWVSGTDLLRAVTDLAVHGGGKITHIAPGEDVAETLEIIAGFSHYFQKLVIFGNPVYLKRLVDEGQQIAWKSLNITVTAGGEATTEAWRDYMAKRLGADLDKEPMRVANAYGAADFGSATATETPLSIRIKRLALKDAPLALAIFGRKANLPNLYQYNPLDHHIEKYGDHFLVSYWSHIPLIRYNIGDRGGVFTFNEMKSILADHGYDLGKLCQGDLKKPFKIPFVYVDTRDDGVVSIGGANVYPGNIETAILEHQELAAHIQHFYLSVVEDENYDSKLIVELVIENLQDQKASWKKEFKQQAYQAIQNVLLRDNQEYKVTWQHNPGVSPRILLLRSPTEPERAIKRKFIQDRPQIL